MTRQILNTLFVTNDRAYVRLDHDTLRVEDEDGARLLQAPLLHLGQIVLYGSSQMSGQAMQRCAADGRCVTFLDYAGRFKARVVGPTSGNVLLRQAQYAAHASEERARSIARSIVAAKIRNSRSLIVRGAREIVSRREALATCADAMANQLAALPDQASLDAIRGIEGMAASLYFERFGDLINRPAEEFSFRVRTRRPPRDRVNAVLSFLYALLTADCVSACEGVGLDPQFGFLHVLRPGRPSLALDLMEELRPLWVDRLTLSLINLRQLRPEHFEPERDGGSVLLTEAGRKVVLVAYQSRKQEETRHPFLRERIPLGLVPHLQARLLARHLRGDLDSYPPFIA